MQHLHRVRHPSRAGPPPRGWADRRSVSARLRRVCHLPPANSSSRSQASLCSCRGCQLWPRVSGPLTGSGGPWRRHPCGRPCVGNMLPAPHPRLGRLSPPRRPAASPFLPWNLFCKDGSSPPARPCLSMCLPRQALWGSPAWRPARSGASGQLHVPVGGLRAGCQRSRTICLFAQLLLRGECVSGAWERW